MALYDTLMSQLSQFKILSFKYSPKPSPPLLSVDSLLPALDPEVISTHPNYEIFLATLKHFFELGRPEKAHKLTLIPHLMGDKDWTSTLSYVLEPDTFLAMCSYVHDKNSDICSAVYKLLITQLATEPVYPQKSIQNTSTLTAQVTGVHTCKVNLITFFHGAATTPYSPGYREELIKTIHKSTNPKDPMMHEQYIDKTDAGCKPSTYEWQFTENATRLKPIFQNSTPLTFTKADEWIQKIKDACDRNPPNLPKLKTGLTQGALLFHKTQFLGNTQCYPFNHTWGAVSSLVAAWDQDLSGLNLAAFKVDDWLPLMLMSIDMAIQVHSHLAQTSPTQITIIAGATHHYHLGLFIESPQELYTQLTTIFRQANALISTANQSTRKQIPLFKIPQTTTPPKTSQKLVEWVASF